MDNKQKSSEVFRYADIFFSCYFNNNTNCIHSQREHAMAYVYSGEMVLEEGKKKTLVRKGECAFIRRDIRVNMTKQAYGEEQYQGIFMMFNRNMLRDLYQKLERRNIPQDVSKFKQSVLKLPQIPEIESLFKSMVPYFAPSVKPKEEFMRLKMIEGVYSLLSIDDRFYPTLFDFTEPWKIDIMDFLDKNYMYDLSLEDIANFTGRSLATFKRDFKKVSELTPQKWIIKKRLETAYEKIKEERQKVGDVYMEVGFKNLSHFSTAFKKEYGIPPTAI